jgi:hypothetical protein
MKCNYCGNESKYSGHCETHWMLGTFFQYELQGAKWNFNEGNDGMMRKYESWIQELSEEDIEDIRNHYWLK